MPIIIKTNICFGFYYEFISKCYLCASRPRVFARFLFKHLFICYFFSGFVLLSNFGAEFVSKVLDALSLKILRIPIFLEKRRQATRRVFKILSLSFFHIEMPHSGSFQRKLQGKVFKSFLWPNLI